MKIGDLVIKKLGRIEVYQQGTVGICLSRYENTWNPWVNDDFIKVAYPGHPVKTYKKGEFEVVDQVR